MLSSKRLFFSKIPLSQCVEGDVFFMDDKWWQVDKVLGNVKKGKEKAQSKIMLKDLVGGSKKEHRVKSEKVDVFELKSTGCRVVEATASGKKYDLKLVELDDDGNDVADAETITISQEVGKLGAYLQDLEQVLLKSVVDEEDERPLFITLPKTCSCKVVQVEERGEATVTPSTNNAILSNGRKVSVPRHVVEGDEILVRLSDESFVEKLQ